MTAQPMTMVGRSYTPGRLPKPNPETGQPSREQLIHALLHQRGASIGITPLEWESETFWFTERGKADHPDVGDGYTPDCPVRLDYLGGLVVYVELTEADDYLHITELPPRVRAKNRSGSRSKRDYILPSQYVAFKREKMALAERENGIINLLLPAMLQDEVLTDIRVLTGLIALKLGSAAAYDAYIDVCLAEKEARLAAAQSSAA